MSQWLTNFTSKGISISLAAKNFKTQPLNCTMPEADLIQAMCAKTITNYELEELIYKAGQAGEKLNNVILNLPPDLKRDLASRLHASASLSLYNTQSTYRSQKAGRKGA